MTHYATRQRETLLKYLAGHADMPLSAGDIAAELADSGISLSAVYRNLSDLESQNRIRRVSVEGSRQAYWCYSEVEECRTHLHLSCSKCGKSFHLEAPVADRLLEAVAQGADFDVDSSSTVLYGICSDCKKAKPE